MKEEPETYSCSTYLHGYIFEDAPWAREHVKSCLFCSSFINCDGRYLKESFGVELDRVRAERERKSEEKEASFKKMAERFRLEEEGYKRRDRRRAFLGMGAAAGIAAALYWIPWTPKSEAKSAPRPGNTEIDSLVNLDRVFVANGRLGIEREITLGNHSDKVLTYEWIMERNQVQLLDLIVDQVATTDLRQQADAISYLQVFDISDLVPFLLNFASAEPMVVDAELRPLFITIFEAVKNA